MRNGYDVSIQEVWRRGDRFFHIIADGFPMGTFDPDSNNPPCDVSFGFLKTLAQIIEEMEVPQDEDPSDWGE